MSRLKHAFLVLALALTTACVEKEGEVKIRVQVKTNQGDPVNGATVALDGKPLGETDNHGAFATQVKVPVGTKPKLEVKKESDAYYFAPYYETFAVTAGEQDFEVKATLYFVPKPSPDGGNIQVNNTPPVANQPAVETAAVPEPSIAEQPRAGQSPADQPANEQPAAEQPSAEANMVQDLPEPPEVAAKAAALVEEIVAEESAQKPELVENDLLAEDAPTAALDPKDVATPNEPAVNLQSLADEAPELSAKGLDTFPTTLRANLGPTVFTVHVFAGETPVPEAEVFIGEEDSNDLRSACKTNARGRCVVRFADKPELPVTFVATKRGFKSATITVPVKNKGKLKIVMEHGHTLDIFAVSKSYNHSVGLKDVEVYVGGKKVGLTDKFGRHSFVHEGKADDLLTITLKPKAFLPETYETDFITSGPMTLVKYFTPEQPPAIRMTVLSPEPAGPLSKRVTEELNSAFDESLRAAARKHLFSSSAFKEYPLALYQRSLKRTGRSLTDTLKIGWQETELKAVVDAVLVPTVVAGDNPTLELSVVDSTGRVLAAAKEDLESLSDKTSMDRAVAVIAKKITRSFPFEGAVLSKEADKVIINIGQAQGRGIKAGDVIDVYGVQAEKLGRSQLYKKVASVTVREVSDSTAKCSVSKLLPRSTIERGDLVALRPRKAPDAGGAEIRIVGGPKASPISQANVYFNDFWIGATDEAGRLYLDATGSGTLKVIKQGFQDYAKPVSLIAQAKIEASLKREAAFLRIDSKPSAAIVKIDGKVLGKTPLSTPIPVPTGFVKLEVVGPAGYKSYSSVLELDQGTLDLAGANTVALEQDYLARTDKLLKDGKNEEALVLLGGIPKEHSDYLLGRHEAGEIFLTLLDQPAKAAEAFGIVTSNEGVKQFADKRFIGSHINEGIALFMTAERLTNTQPEAAKAHYAKALEVLDNVLPHLRFVPSAQYDAAVHNVDYHRALSRHRIWTSTKDPRYLAEAVRTWKSYLDGDARSVPADGNSKKYVQNAEVYYKQAQASLNSAKSVSKQ